MLNDTREAGELVRDYMSEYSAYVAQSRAIPSLVDGLKPVHRRILNSASDLHLYHDHVYMKTAKLEGQVMGDYHPHGGADVTTLVQPFNIRYPLIDGKGNWGSSDDPGSVAASRYTEVRLTKFAEDFYLESADYADREPNYDGRLQEIVRYYPPIPGCLLTSARGIAIGLTTLVPSHEIGMVCDSILDYLDGRDYIKGMYPDTCEKSITLSSKEDLRKLYETGSGSIRYKAATHYERAGKDHLLVVDAFPPGFMKKRLSTNSTLLEYIDSGDLSLSNESSENIRYVFRCKDKSILEKVEDLLESTVSYKFHIEHDGVIALYPLKEIYKEFIASRKEYIRKKYFDLLTKVSEEAKYLEDLMRFKESKYVSLVLDMKEKELTDYLISEGFNPTSVSRILSTPIRILLKDNVDTLQKKLSDCKSKMEEYTGYLSDLISKIKKDIKYLKTQYGSTPNTVLFSERSSTKNTTAEVHGDYVGIYDDEGFVIVSKEILGDRYPIDLIKTESIEVHTVEIDDISNYVAEYSDVIVPLGNWSIRKRKSKIIAIETKTKELIGIRKK